MRRLALLLMMSLSASGAAAQPDAKLGADLARVAKLRVFFGHQSVGENVLEGVQQLAKQTGTPLRVAPARSAAEVQPGVLGHAFIGENRHPLKKIEAFDQALAGKPGPGVALMKFCYLDIDQNTDAAALFTRYQQNLAALKARHPGTTFVHVTAPVTEVQGGIKGSVKRLLGRAPYGALENQRRAEYNALLRKAYAGREPIFDLARVESTAPDGKTVQVEWAGRESPALAAAWTDDGHHLNAEGRRRAARELIAVLAALP